MAKRKVGAVSNIKRFYGRAKKKGAEYYDQISDSELYSMADRIYKRHEQRLPNLKKSGVSDIFSVGNTEHFISLYENAQKSPFKRQEIIEFIKASKEAFMGNKADYYTKTGAVAKIATWGVKKGSNGELLRDSRGHYIKKEWAAGRTFNELIEAREHFGALVKEFGHDFFKIYGSDEAMDAILVRMTQGLSYQQIHDELYDMIINSANYKNYYDDQFLEGLEEGEFGGIFDR